MRFDERVLHHQIQPIKLATDITIALVSVPLFWQHWLVAGLLVHVVPPGLASWYVISRIDLEPLKRSRTGECLSRSMNAPVTIIRGVGDILTVWGAWIHAPFMILGGFALVGAAWAYVLRPKIPESRT